MTSEAGTLAVSGRGSGRFCFCFSMYQTVFQKPGEQCDAYAPVEYNTATYTRHPPDTWALHSTSI